MRKNGTKETIHSVEVSVRKRNISWSREEKVGEEGESTAGVN